MGRRRELDQLQRAYEQARRGTSVTVYIHGESGLGKTALARRFTADMANRDPQVIVLDEPTASLDFGNQGKVMNEVRTLAKSGHGVLFTTHDPNHALRAADRAYLLREGKRLDEGPVDTVLQRAQLEALYGAPVQLISDENRRAFLPG